MVRIRFKNLATISYDDGWKVRMRNENEMWRTHFVTLRDALDAVCIASSIDCVSRTYIAKLMLFRPELVELVRNHYKEHHVDISGVIFVEF